MITRMLAVLFATMAALSAQSQPSTPTPPKIGQAPQQEAERQNGIPKTEINISGQPVTITVNPSSAQAQATEPNQTGREENDNSTVTWTNWIIAFFAFVLAVVGGFQAWTYWLTLSANKIIERAYISISHTPPGVRPSDAKDGKRTLYTTFGFQNLGNTPATVIDAGITYVVSEQPLPRTPQYQRNEPKPAAFLVKNERFFLHGTFVISVDYWDAIQAGQKKLWILGYCDYIDAFRIRHRAGYARYYDPAADIHPSAQRNNLHFVLQDGYNDDREIDEQGQPKKKAYMRFRELRLAGAPTHEAPR